MGERNFIKTDHDIKRAIVSSHSSIRTVEQPAGVVDGSNTVFTASKEFYSNSLMVYLAGVRKFEGTDYQVTGTRTIQFISAPASGVMYFDYVPPDQLIEA